MDVASILLVLAVAGANFGSQSETDASPPAKRHTSYFAGQPGWNSETSSPPPAAAPTGSRYQSGTSGNGATISAPPSVVDRSRSAVIESGNALRDGVEAGIQAANRQLYQGNEQVIDTARNAGQDLSNQFQSWAGATAQQAQITVPSTTASSPQTTGSRQQVSNPFTTAAPAASSAPAATPKTRGGMAPPPWTGSAASDEPDWPTDAATVPMATEAPRMAALGSAPVQTDSGWTSVHSGVAPPRLAAPQLFNSTEADMLLRTESANTAPLQPLPGEGGPNFPATITSGRPADHSVLAPSQAEQRFQSSSAAPSTSNWDFGWDGKTASQPTQAATIGNRYETAAITPGTDVNGARDLAAQQQPANQPQTQSQLPKVQSQDSPPATTFGIGAWDNRGWPESPAAPQTGAVAQRDTPAGGATIVGNAAAQPATGSVPVAGMPQNVANPGTVANGATPQEGAAPALPMSTAEQLPWLPLLVVSLSLAGSIGANLFLGWSYIDARQKYRTLVQKTANKFRRAVAA